MVGGGCYCVIICCWLLVVGYEDDSDIVHKNMCKVLDAKLQCAERCNVWSASCCRRLSCVLLKAVALSCGPGDEEDSPKLHILFIYPQPDQWTVQ